MRAVHEIMDKIQEAINSDDITNTLSYGDIDDVINKKQTIFPLVHIGFTGASFDDRVTTLSFYAICMDAVDESKSTDKLFIGDTNELDVLNTQLAVVAWLREYLRRKMPKDINALLVGTGNAEAFRDRFEDRVAGWTFTFDVQYANDMTICLT